MNEGIQGFLHEVAASIGEQWVDTRRETLARYGEHTLPAPVREPSAVLFPASTEHVRAIVLAANRWRVELYPISTGNNIGLGSRAPTSAGQVVVDLGYRMNRILQVNEETCYAELEPGVSFQMLHDELARRGNKLMVSATSGPPHGGIIGNALDRGAGYGPTSTTSACSAGWRSSWATATSSAPATAVSTPRIRSTGTSRGSHRGRRWTGCSRSPISAS